MIYTRSISYRSNLYGLCRRCLRCRLNSLQLLLTKRTTGYFFNQKLQPFLRIKLRRPVRLYEYLFTRLCGAACAGSPTNKAKISKTKRVKKKTPEFVRFTHRKRRVSGCVHVYEKIRVAHVVNDTDKARTFIRTQYQS